MLPRHSRLWLTASGWAGLAAQVAAQHQPILEQWRVADWPVVLRRQDSDSAPDQLCVGIACPPAPPSGFKLRLALRVEAAQIRCWQPALTLSEILPAAPCRWQAGLRTALTEATAQGLTLRVYGSMAWQVTTGLRYLRAGSDLDLWITPANLGQLDQALRLLQRHAMELPLDGEIGFPDAAAVAWKELAQQRHAPSARVLIKRPEHVELVRIDALLAQYTLPVSQPACPA